MEHSEKRVSTIIELYDLKEFMEYAKEAPLFIYEPQFFSSPFNNETKMKSVTCYAIGVKFQDISIILKYQKNWEKADCLPNTERQNPKDVMDTSMQAFINQLKNQFHALRGKISGDNILPWGDYLEFK